MLIDILFVAFLVLAIFKGLSNGFIVAICSVLGLFIGLAAAMKLSVVVAGYLHDSVNLGSKWLPVISFIIVFVVVIFLVRLGAIALQKTVELAMLGWLNRLAGMLVYLFFYSILLRIMLFYADKLRLLTPETFAASKTWPWLQPVGPKAMDAIGSLIPWFKDMFHQLGIFFDHVAEKAPPRMTA